MARINIEDSLWADPRFQDLMIKVGNRHMAKGMVLELWTLAQKYWIASRGEGIPKPAWDSAGMPSALIECNLARDNGDFIYAVGSKEQFAWLNANSENGKRGGPAAAKTRVEKIKKSKRPKSSRHVENRPDTSSYSSSSSLSSSFSNSDSVSKEVPAGASPDRPTLNHAIWEVYEAAYLNRYQVEPARNATVNAQIAQLGKRLGKDAVDVVRFYLRHNKAYYVQKQHTIGPLLADAESLHTQWQRGEAMLSTRANEIERTQHNFDSFSQAAEILDRKDGTYGN